MFKPYFFILILLALLISCKKDENRFGINKNNIGLLTDTTNIKELKSVFPDDSIVNFEGDSIFEIPMDLVEIYEKNGKLLLTLTPKNISDSTSKITNIRIEDSRFKTEKGISKLSTFKDIQDAYKISKIDNLINAVVLSVNEINAQFAIDKKELPANLRYDMNMYIEASQIPDNAKIKYFFINWD